MSGKEPGYYVVVPSFVRHDKKLTDGAKLLYGDIAGLCSKKGYCFASNSYLADVAGVSNRTVTTYIGQLEERGHIQVSGTDKREIRLAQETSTPREETCEKPVEENFQHTNTGITNTVEYNDLPEISEVRDYFVSHRLKPQDALIQAESFIEYWRDPDAGDKRNPPTAAKWKNHARTWRNNGVKWELFELIPEDEFKRRNKTYTLDEIRIRPGDDIYDTTRYEQVGDNQYRRI